MPSIEALKKVFGEVIDKDDTLQALNNKVQYVDTRNIENIWDYAVSNGYAFVAEEVFNIDPSTPEEIVFINPAGSGKTVKVRLLMVRGRVDGEVEIHFDPAIDTNGDGLDILNKQVGSDNSSVVTIEHGGSYSGYSTKRTRGIITGGTGNFAVGGTSTMGLAGEILEGHGLYIKITNKDNSANDFDFRIEWWEETQAGP